ncbi:hypothetical protein ZWY2020_032147 [Hordeum vulgare]|nr:hypothetical protein ZWY2020_032147 [Hordeum vulgare]
MPQASLRGPKSTQDVASRGAQAQHRSGGDGGGSVQLHHGRQALLAAAGAFAGVLLALIALHLYNSGRRRRAQDRRRQLRRSPAISGVGEAPRRGARPGGAPRAPWSPRTWALETARSASPSSSTASRPALPRCGHRFHVECIDAWFRDNSTCPLCRADVEAPDAAEAHPEVRIDGAGAADAAAKDGAPAIAREDVQRHGS